MAVRLGLQPQFSRTDLAGGFPASRLIDVEEVVDPPPTSSGRRARRWPPSTRSS